VNVAQRVAFNTIVQIAARVVSFVLLLVAFGLVTRYLGVEGFGAYALVLTVVALAVSIADLGLTQIGVRELAARRAGQEHLVGNLLALRAAVAVAAALVLVVISPFVPYEDRVQSGLRIGAAAALFLILAGLPAIVFQATMRLHLAAMVELVGSASGLLLVVVATEADLGYSALIAAVAVAACVSTLTAFALASRLMRLRPRFIRSEVRGLLAASLPVALFSLLGILHFRIDTVLLSLLKSLDDVGTYSAAYRFPEQVLFVPALFIAAVYPLLAAYAARDDPQLGHMVNRSLAFLLLIGFPLAAATAMLAPNIVDLVAGSSFEDAVGPLRVLTLATVFLFVNTLFSSLLIVFDEQRGLASVIGVALLANIGLNLLLIPPFGPIGAATATVVTEGASGVFLAIWTVRRGSLSLDLSPLPRIAAATLGMTAVLAATEALPLAVTAAAGATSYCGLAYLFGVVRRSDLGLLLIRSPRPANGSSV
jgi:O-antigen/teichoic acid export membrane protein